MPKQLRRAVVLKRLSRGRCLPLRKAGSDTSPTADPEPASGGALGDHGVIIIKELALSFLIAILVVAASSLITKVAQAIGSAW
jgi:hypothetical protein